MAFDLSQAPITYHSTATTDDTLVYSGSGYLCSITVTTPSAGAVNLYDTAVASGAGTMAAEAVLMPTITLAGTEVHPIHWNFSNPIRFRYGLGLDLGATAIKVTLVYSKDKAT